MDNLRATSVRRHMRLRRKETHIVQPLEHVLEHARPLGAVAR